MVLYDVYTRGGFSEYIEDTASTTETSSRTTTTTTTTSSTSRRSARSLSELLMPAKQVGILILAKEYLLFIPKKRGAG
jgi:hypothetical protein